MPIMPALNFMYIHVYVHVLRHEGNVNGSLPDTTDTSDELVTSLTIIYTANTNSSDNFSFLQIQMIVFYLLTKFPTSMIITCSTYRYTLYL